MHGQVMCCIRSFAAGPSSPGGLAAEWCEPHIHTDDIDTEQDGKAHGLYNDIARLYPLKSVRDAGWSLARVNVCVKGVYMLIR
jgi:hypothetical protein